MLPAPFLDRATALVAACRDRGLVLATAESCTGGLVSALITEVPGSSAAFDRGFATYSNAAKAEMLGVSPALIAAEGAVSEAVARAMAAGALARSGADIAVSITGVAGPGGGTAAKPVGLVHFARARRDGAVTAVERRFGDIGRNAVRLASVAQALELFEGAL
ncbi:CinA family protein [Lichenibacterium minor]|uniref:CinA family protein n=1 Tax=Lichenibacterium minor TaxID=2316528 RepID=A0A4Q2U9C8_9HYPH|nr:CinA family protein [Lichenibacterium minor]RYC31771.1 CinA family protein [Lichenibacterium minor]